VERLAAEPGVEPEQTAMVNAMIAASHRFAHAMIALEAGIPQFKGQAPRPEFRVFAGEIEKTLKLLACKLAGERVGEREFPDLRQAYTRLIQTGDPKIARYAFTNLEADRMVNSLNTLREQVFAWHKMQKAPIGEKSGIDNSTKTEINTT
jgi:hypothetical protein